MPRLTNPCTDITTCRLDGAVLMYYTRRNARTYARTHARMHTSDFDKVTSNSHLLSTVDKLGQERKLNLV